MAEARRGPCLKRRGRGDGTIVGSAGLWAVALAAVARVGTRRAVVAVLRVLVVAVVSIVVGMLRLCCTPLWRCCRSGILIVRCTVIGIRVVVAEETALLVVVMVVVMVAVVIRVVMLVVMLVMSPLAVVVPLVGVVTVALPLLHRIGWACGATGHRAMRCWPPTATRGRRR